MNRWTYTLAPETYAQLVAMLANYWGAPEPLESVNWLTPAEVISLASEYARRISAA